MYTERRKPADTVDDGLEMAIRKSNRLLRLKRLFNMLNSYVQQVVLKYNERQFEDS